MADSNPPNSTSPAPSIPGAAIPGVETNAVPLYAGSVSQWMGAKMYFLCLLAVLAGAALLFYWGAYGHDKTESKTALIEGKAAMIAGFALLASSFIMFIYVWMAVKSCRYTITQRHIEREMGLFVKKIDALPMGHVKRVDLKQSFIGRMVNVGTIEVFCGDDDTRAHWLLEGLPNPRPTYEKLRDAVMELTNRRGIILE